MRGIVPKAVAVPCGEIIVIALPTAIPSRRASRAPTATPSSSKSASEPWTIWSATRGRRLSVKIAERTGLGIDTEMAVETENPAEQVSAKAIHHRHNDDQGGNPKRDPEQREDRDYRDKPLLPSRPQITKRDHPLECAEDHAGGALLKSRSPGRALFPRKCPVVPPSGGVLARPYRRRSRAAR